MSKPKTLGEFELRELSEALGERTKVTFVKRLISGPRWSGQRVEFSLVLSDDQVEQLAQFMSENYNVAPFVGL